jgi:hypothetical protein
MDEAKLPRETDAFRPNCATCYRCGLVALRRDDLLRRYGCDYRIARTTELYAHHHPDHLANARAAFE